MIKGTQTLYSNFPSIPPPIGEFIDPIFETKIKRISNAVTQKTTFISPEYPTINPYNSDETYVILLHFDHFALYDVKNNYNFVRDLNEIKARSEPRWSPDWNVLFFFEANRIRLYAIKQNRYQDYYIFNEYVKIYSRGEADVSQDGSHIVMAGIKAGSVEQDIFVFDANTNKKGKVLTTLKDFDNLYITSKNNVIVEWREYNKGSARFTGTELFDQDMQFVRQLTQSDGHKDVLNDFIVWCTSNEVRSGSNSALRINCVTNERHNLITFDWSLLFHVSGSDNGLALISTYSSNKTKDSWKLYDNELLLVNIFTGDITRLCHHYSAPLDDYTWQPKAVINKDGTKILFSSNFGMQPHLNYCDTYLIELNKTPAIEVPTDPIIPDASLAWREVARFGIRNDKRYSVRFEYNEIVIDEGDITR